jgi:hypothetical protein
MELARLYVAAIVGFALFWYEWKRGEAEFRRIVREEITQVLVLHGVIKREETPRN